VKTKAKKVCNDCYKKHLKQDVLDIRTLHVTTIDYEAPALSTGGYGGEGRPPGLQRWIEDSIATAATNWSTGLTAALSSTAKNELSYAELTQATDNFAASGVLGKGAFAVVYAGQLKNEKVAVKVDLPDSSENIIESMKIKRILEIQFVSEISTIYSHPHPNICRLLGHCIDGPTRCLVYEFCANGDLYQRLSSSTSQPALTWPQRVHIAVGTARGLAFLHAAKPDPIIHRDVKSLNILLDEHLNAKISDFGTVREQKRSLHTNMANAETHMTTKIVIGTDQYMPPEYVQGGKISIKTDAFAFGMVSKISVFICPNPYDF
jgi:hypothetical protein